ncbi:MAG: rRNA maturation RNase YbeY [Pirellulales bacterium]|nr:rRNA maturation RNase YbeY [Pirellulales bacterium]
MKDSKSPIARHVVTICNETDRDAIDEERLRRGVCLVLQEHGVESAVIGVAIVTDTSMQEMNRKYLNHDYPTDVLSFPLKTNSLEPLEGEIAISLDTASRLAEEYHWSAEDELLLYAIHGTLHLVGFTDEEEEEKMKMRAQERAMLKKMGLTPPESATRPSESVGGCDENSAHLISQPSKTSERLQ